METPNSREISGHTACMLPNLMPFGSCPVLVIMGTEPRQAIGASATRFCG